MHVYVNIRHTISTALMIIILFYIYSIYKKTYVYICWVLTPHFGAQKVISTLDVLDKYIYICILFSIADYEYSLLGKKSWVSFFSSMLTYEYFIVIQDYSFHRYNFFHDKSKFIWEMFILHAIGSTMQYGVKLATAISTWIIIKKNVAFDKCIIIRQLVNIYTTSQPAGSYDSYRAF